jgi:rhamnosyltransferase subunit B
LHPCIGLALELQRRGHSVTIAATEFYRGKVEGMGIEFGAIRPDWNPTDPELIRQCEDLKRGPEVLYRQMILPHLKATYDDLLAIADGADLMIAGELVYAAPLVAERLSLRWASAILSPFSFFSSHDPSVMVNAPRLIHLRKAGWIPYRAGLNIGRLATRHWSNPVRRLRHELGLQTKCDPIFKDKFSPDLVLALFSPQLAKAQRDWPPQTLQPGFVFANDHAQGTAPSSQLAAFLAAGDAPIVFTQGSTAVHNPGDFYQVSVEAARRLGRRAVMLGTDSGFGQGAADVLGLSYVPYSEIFPHGAINVHQGGSGTTGEALRAGRPMLVVPYGWDQPDNATRVEKLGVGLHLPRSLYSVATAATALKRIIENPRLKERAVEVGALLQKEEGSKGACDAIESLLSRSRDGSS